MVVTKEELRATLKLERALYLEDKALTRFLAHSKNYVIWKWQKCLRHEEYHLNKLTSVFHKVAYLFYKRRKNILGARLGFDVPANCFEEGLLIYHVGPVTVNGDARVGRNCRIAGNVCIGGKEDGAPVIGDDCSLGYGSIVVGDVELGKNVVVGAGAVVVGSFPDGAVLAGVPAKDIR